MKLAPVLSLILPVPYRENIHLAFWSAYCPPSAYFLSHTFKVDFEMLYVLVAACLVIPFIKESTTSSFRSSLYPPGRLLWRTDSIPWILAVLSLHLKLSSLIPNLLAQLLIKSSPLIALRSSRLRSSSFTFVKNLLIGFLAQLEGHRSDGRAIYKLTDQRNHWIHFSLSMYSLYPKPFGYDL